MPASPNPELITFVIPALITWRRTAGRPDPTASRLSKLVGYYTQGARPNHTRLSEYRTWKDHVRAHAPPGLLRVRPQDEASRVRLDVVCHFASRTHADPENVRKGIVDALFPHGDKWVYGGHDHPRYDPSRPRVEITVTLFQGAPIPTPGRPEHVAETAPRARARAGSRTRRPDAAPTRERKSGTEPKKAKPSAPERVGASPKSGRTSKKKETSVPAQHGWWAALGAWIAGWSGRVGKPVRRPARTSRKRRR